MFTIENLEHAETHKKFKSRMWLLRYNHLKLCNYIFLFLITKVWRFTISESPVAFQKSSMLHQKYINMPVSSHTPTLNMSIFKCFINLSGIKILIFILIHIYLSFSIYPNLIYVVVAFLFCNPIGCLLLAVWQSV